MKQITYFIFVILSITSVSVIAQDKVFLKNGETLNVKVIALSSKTISYRDTTPESPLVTIPKNDVLLLEYKSGVIYTFGNSNSFEPVSTSTDVYETRAERRERKFKEWKKKEQEMPNGIFGFYLPELAVGRFTLSYERLFSDKTIGVKIPMSLTYDPFGFISTTSTTTSGTTTTTNQTNRALGVKFITGIDVNYYHDLQENLKYYFGPRIRYGTDQMLGGIEGLSVQLQNGILRSRGERFTSTFGFGIGFFKLSQKYSNTLSNYEPNQVYPWGSITWRLGFRL